MAETRPSFWKRNRRLVWLAGTLLVVLLLATVTAAIAAHYAEPFVRNQIVRQLEEHFNAHVELDGLRISIADGFWISGRGLRVWPPAQSPDLSCPGPGKPLVDLARFRFHIPFPRASGKPIHIPVVQLDGLNVSLPPKSQFRRSAAAAPNPAAPPRLRFQIDRMECTRALLVIETDKPGKLPLDFAIAQITLTGIASGGAMGFHARLTIPKPVGDVETSGSFGPWQVEDPGESPVSGSYRFDHADLATFKGIAGILNSTGRYQGTLRNLAVEGDTNTPDFRLTHFGNALPLTTHFRATVDGTDGDTWLHPVEAVLGHAHFTAEGQIVRVPSDVPGERVVRGHDIGLSIDVKKAPIDDFLRLASRSPRPLLTGDVAVKATLHIPPGEQPVHERMKLAGTFILENARFTSDKIQERVEQLSLRGQGRPHDVKSTDPDTIQSHMQGAFQMGGGVLKLPSLEYIVPGADIRLAGTYKLDGGALNFEGRARMEASISEMVGGWKGILLKPADRLFKRNGVGASIPIHIRGTRENPSFGIDFGRIR